MPPELMWYCVSYTVSLLGCGALLNRPSCSVIAAMARNRQVYIHRALGAGTEDARTVHWDKVDIMTCISAAPTFPIRTLGMEVAPFADFYLSQFCVCILIYSRGPRLRCKNAKISHM